MIDPFNLSIEELRELPPEFVFQVRFFRHFGDGLDKGYVPLIGLDKPPRDHPCMMQQTARQVLGCKLLASMQDLPCETCEGRGRISKNLRVGPCPDCGGSGRRET